MAVKILVLSDDGRRLEIFSMFLKQIMLGATPALGLGVLMTFGSSIGQTFFVSLFAGEIRSELSLSHGMFGTFYSAATLASAIAFLWLGKFADQVDLTLLGALALLALSGFAMLMANANSLTILFLSLFGLRLFGQGLCGHVAMTAMARWFSRERGRALSVASLGHPIGEALLPFLVAKDKGLYKKLNIDLEIIEPDNHYDGFLELEKENIQFATNEPLHLIEKYHENILSLGNFFETSGGIIFSKNGYEKFLNDQAIKITSPVSNPVTDTIALDILKRHQENNSITRKNN